jgi:hypothetical protein
MKLAWSGPVPLPRPGQQRLTVNLNRTGTDPLVAVIKLIQGTGLVIATKAVQPDPTFGNLTITLPDEQSAPITDYNDLHVEVTAWSGVIVACCPQPLKPVLYATFNNVNDCPCAVGVSFPVLWNGTSWEGTGPLGTCGHPVKVTLTPQPPGSSNCFAGTVAYPDNCHPGGSTGIACNPDDPSCSPFAATTNPFSCTAACGCTLDTSNLTITFTQ